MHRVAGRGLRAIYRPEYNYAKAGAMLPDLHPPDFDQLVLDLDQPGTDRTRLMSTLDTLDDRYAATLSCSPAAASRATTVDSR